MTQHKAKKTIRFDYFAKVRMGGTDYIAKIDVEAFPNVNNYKIHRKKKIDLIPKSRADVGQIPTAGDFASSLSDNASVDTLVFKDSIANQETNVKPNLKPNGADVFRELPTNAENVRKYGAMHHTRGNIPNRTTYRENRLI